MAIDEWLSEFDAMVDSSDLVLPAAAAFASFVRQYAAHLATIIEARLGECGELVILDFQTARPQKSATSIKHVERIGVLFAHTDAMPHVYVLRPDFPDTAHQQLTIEGAPRAICIDDRSWAEARLTWTPAELVHRIHSWFARAARGELHDVRQPLDPQLIGSPLSFIISRHVLRHADEYDLIAAHNTDHYQTLQVMSIEKVGEPNKKKELMRLFAYQIPPENMKRMSFAPKNLGSLSDMLALRGIDLFDDLRKRFSGWLADPDPSACGLQSRFAVIVEMPIVSPDGVQQDGTDLRAFVTDQAVGDIAVALGVAMAAAPDEGSSVGYVKPLIPKPFDHELVHAIIAQSAEVHYEFDRELATRLTGRREGDDRKVVMVGAGAIGSHVAECLSREGRFQWTIIDDDRLLPHNIARHIGRGGNVTEAKAELVAKAISETIENSTPIAASIKANAMTDGPMRAEIDQALERAELIIDSTACVPVARFLSDHKTAARRASVFFNPAGDAAVLLIEPADRSLTLRDLEAQYLGLVIRDTRLATHFDPPSGTYAYTGACRAMTSHIPHSRVMTLSGLVASGLGKAVDLDSGLIKVWSMSDAGTVDVHEILPWAVQAFRAGEWTISIDEGLMDRIRQMRNRDLPNETGGVLTGVVDIPAKRIHLVDAAPAPHDSLSSGGGFTRGTKGVQRHLDDVFQRTGGQTRYVGEWHSHPPRAATDPSVTDLVQIDWLAALFAMDTLPALMLISGDRDMTIVLANRPAEAVKSTVGCPMTGRQ